MDCSSAEAWSEDVRQENKQLLRGDAATRTSSQTRGRWCLVTAMLAGAIVLIQARASRINAAKAITTAAKPENVVTLSIAKAAEPENAVIFPKHIYDRVAGKDAEIDAFELRPVLSRALKKELAGKTFSLEASRTLVVSGDLDFNGKLDYSEFRDAWRSMMDWKGAFSGGMTASELRDALAKLGFKLSTPVLECLALRYADKNGRVSVDDFVVICCRIKSAYGSYLSYQGKSFSLDDYLLNALYTEKASKTTRRTKLTLITLPENSSKTSALDKTFKAFADRVAGKDAEIDAFELRHVLFSALKKELAGKTFSLEASRTLVVSGDLDRNGKLDYSEFRDAWRSMMDWKGAFSDGMTAIELRDALAKLGFKLSTPILACLVLRYAGENGSISIDDFIVICCRIKSAYGSYLSVKGKSFSLDDYLLSVLYS